MLFVLKEVVTCLEGMQHDVVWLCNSNLMVQKEAGSQDMKVKVLKNLRPLSTT